MGFYIETNSNYNKAETISLNYQGEIISKPQTFNEIPSDKGLICVVNNGMFEAAGYCFDEREFNVFTNPEDIRPKKYVLIDKDLAEKLSGFKQ